MAETADDLSTPLGQDGLRRKHRPRLPFTGMQALAVLLGLFLATFAGYAVFNEDPLGGEPVSRIAIHEPGSAGKKALKQQAETPPRPPAVREQKTVTIIDGSSGARQSVVLGSNNEADDAAEPALTTPPGQAGIDPRLLEKSRYGMIPVAAEGLKPFNVYAARTDRTKADRMPTVTIVISGLGVGAAKTADAIMRLPPAVTLAFTPYGTDPGKLAERARAQGHEIFLQIPMEPYDFPDNDPGPQTLLTSLGAEENIDRLHWHLSRMQGYAGIANFTGAHFMATDTAMQPIVRDAARRGLGLFDDGSSPGGVAQQIATSQDMPFGRGDISIDVVPTANEIDRALAKLESIARERGTAIGTASALPVSIERIGTWIRALDSHGIMLVPLTTAMQKSKST